MLVQIESLTFDCIIGILDFERESAQKVIVDICFEYDFENNEKFIDYSEVAFEIETIMKREKFKLLENSIIFLENYLNKKYSIKNLKIKVSKPNILTNCIVSLSNK